MPVEFYRGEEFQFPQERKAEGQIVDTFRAAFGRIATPVFVVFNFFCNGEDFDLLILKPDAILVVDLKECDKPITATEVGPWQILTGGSLHGNPSQQVRK